jgi:hypothetical protein
MTMECFVEWRFVSDVSNFKCVVFGVFLRNWI